MRWIGERPGIGGCAASSSQGWTREHRRLAALADRPLGRRERGVREESGRATPLRAGRRRPRTVPVSGGISTSDQPSPRDAMRPGEIRTRARAAAPASWRRRSGTRRRRARRSAAAPGCRIDHSAARWTPAAHARGRLDRVPGAQQVLAGTLRPSSRRRGGGGRRGLRSRGPGAPLRGEGPGSAGRSSPRKNTVARCRARRQELEQAAEGRLDPRRVTSPTARGSE